MPELLALTRPVSYSFLDAHLNCDFPASLVLDGAVNLPKDVAEMIPAVFRNDSCMMRSLIVEDPGGTSTCPFDCGSLGCVALPRQHGSNVQGLDSEAGVLALEGLSKMGGFTSTS